MNHPFWGNIKKDSSSCTAGITFSHPFFGAGETEILLDLGPDNTMPDKELLLEYATTYSLFLNNIPDRLTALQQAMFDTYRAYFAQDDENTIETLDHHNEYIKHLAFVRIGGKGRVELCFFYSLINAPVHSVTFIGEKVYACYDDP